MKIDNVVMWVVCDELNETFTRQFSGKSYNEAHVAALDFIQKEKEAKKNSAMNQLMRTAAEMVNTAYRLRKGEQPVYAYRDYDAKHTVREFLKTFSVMTGEEIEQIDAEFGALVVKAFRNRYPGRDPKRTGTVYLKRENRNINVFTYGDEHLDLLFEVYASKDWHKVAQERLKDDAIPF